MHARVEECHRSREFANSLKLLDAAYPANTTIKLILDNHSAHVSEETKAAISSGPCTYGGDPPRQGRQARGVPARSGPTAAAAYWHTAGGTVVCRPSTGNVLTRRRVGQIVWELANAAGITKRVYPHLQQHTVATRLLALGMDITDLLQFLGHPSLRRYDGRHATAQVRTVDRPGPLAG